MSTEHDDTRPVPAQPAHDLTQPLPAAGASRGPGTDDATRPVPATPAHDAGDPAPAPGPVPATDDATRPLPRTGAGRPDEPTQVLGTAPDGAATAPDVAAAAPDDAATGPGVAATAPGEAGPSAATDPGVSRSVRVGTVVWGLVVAVVGAGMLAIAAGAVVDLELALIGLLALAGVSLVVGSVVSATRQRRSAAVPGASPGPGRTARARR